MIIAFNILKPVGGLVGDFDNCTICFISTTKKVKYNRNISGKSDDWLIIIYCHIWLLPPPCKTKTQSVVIHIHTNEIENETNSIKNKEGREKVCFKVLASCCEIMMDFVSNFFDKSLKPFQQNKFSLAWCAKTSQSKKATTFLKSDRIIMLYESPMLSEFKCCRI